MKNTRLLTLGLLAATLFLSGCATETTRYGKNTYIMGGLVTIRKADFIPVAANGAQVDTTKWFGKGNPSGNSVDFLYDAIKFTNY
jgi:hypothetical protein